VVLITHLLISNKYCTFAKVFLIACRITTLGNAQYNMKVIVITNV